MCVLWTSSWRTVPDPCSTLPECTHLWTAHQMELPVDIHFRMPESRLIASHWDEALRDAKRFSAYSKLVKVSEAWDAIQESRSCQKYRVLRGLIQRISWPRILWL